MTEEKRKLTDAEAQEIAEALGTRGKCECGVSCWATSAKRRVWIYWTEETRYSASDLDEMPGCPWCLARLLPNGWVLPEDWRERLVDLIVAAGVGARDPDGFPLYFARSIAYERPAPAMAEGCEWRASLVGLACAYGPTQDLALLALLRQSRTWTKAEED